MTRENPSLLLRMLADHARRQVEVPYDVSALIRDRERAAKVRENLRTARVHLQSVIRVAP